MIFLCARVYVLVFQPEHDLTIIQLEKQLRLCVETMTKDKQERLALMKSRMKVDQHLCDALNAIPYYIPTGCVPSDRQLVELDQHIRDLELEQVKIIIRCSLDLSTLLNRFASGIRKWLCSIAFPLFEPFSNLAIMFSCKIVIFCCHWEEW